jgi:phospholysine phosphohistidine inorganic pyrophosphate phosphatase
MSAILFDLDGVLYEGDKVIDGAADVIHWCNQNKIPHLYLTNTTSKSRAALVDKLAGFGIESTIENFLTPPVAARQWLHANSIDNIALYVPETTREEFSDFNLVCDETADVDAVVVGDLGEQWTFATMNEIFRTLIDKPGVKLIALGMTRYWRAASGLQLDVGPIIKAFEYASGIDAVVTGKPALEFYRAALSLLAVASDNEQKKIVMIGDDIRGDIEASQQAGLTAILVRSGKFKPSDLQSGVRPDAVLDSVVQLPEWWQTNR